MIHECSHRRVCVRSGPLCCRKGIQNNQWGNGSSDNTALIVIGVALLGVGAIVYFTMF
jgi:hypothetical protein